MEPNRDYRGTSDVPFSLLKQRTQGGIGDGICRLFRSVTVDRIFRLPSQRSLLYTLCSTRTLGFKDNGFRTCFRGVTSAHDSRNRPKKFVLCDGFGDRNRVFSSKCFLLLRRINRANRSSDRIGNAIDDPRCTQSPKSSVRKRNSNLITVKLRKRITYPVPTDSIPFTTKTDRCFHRRSRRYTT